MRASIRLTPRQSGQTLSRFEAAESYRRATAVSRRRTALCVDRIV